MSLLKLVAAGAAIGGIAAFLRPSDGLADADDSALEVLPLAGSAAMIEDEALSGQPSSMPSAQTSAGAYGTPSSPVL